MKRSKQEYKKLITESSAGMGGSADVWNGETDEQGRGAQPAGAQQQPSAQQSTVQEQPIESVQQKPDGTWLKTLKFPKQHKTKFILFDKNKKAIRNWESEYQPQMAVASYRKQIISEAKAKKTMKKKKKIKR